jgi:hypothetical protein
MVLYCQAFSLLSGHCFRMIQAEDGTGHAPSTARTSLWRGRFKDGAGKWRAVEAGDGHRAEVDAVQRISDGRPSRDIGHSAIV